MHLFFQTQSLQLLIFDMDCQEFLANLDYVLFMLIPYAYVSIESIDCILLSSFDLRTILLITSVKTLCLSVLNLCCAFNISLFFKNSFRSSLTLSTSIFFFSK